MTKPTEKEVAKQYNQIAKDFDALCDKCRTYTDPKTFAYCNIRFVVEKMLGFGASPEALQALMARAFVSAVQQHEEESSQNG